MRSSPKIILKLIEDSNVGFKNAKDTPEIFERISKHYSEALLDELINLNKATVEKYLEYGRLYGEQLEATINLKAFQGVYVPVPFFHKLFAKEQEILPVNFLTEEGRGSGQGFFLLQ